MPEGVLRRFILAMVATAAFGALLLWGPPICPTKNLFGVPCPGCGLTRATLALLHGDLHAAVHFHPFVFVMTPIFFLVIAEEVVGFVRRKPAAWLAKVPNAILWPVLVGMMLLWVVRFFGVLGGPVDPVNPWGSLLGRAVKAILSW